MPTVLEQILNFIYPLYCEICRKNLSADNKRHLCDQCLKKIKLLQGHYCPKPDIKTKIYFRHSQAVGRYEGILKECIHLVKYRKKKILIRVLAEVMIKYIEDYIDIKAFDYIMSVPLYKKQYRKRGFNQADLLASEIGRYFNKKIMSNDLKRIKYTQPQYKLNKFERIKNTKGAFFIKNSEIFHKKAVLLIDDVYTTGATVNGCSKVLYKAGAKLVDVLVLAHGS